MAGPVLEFSQSNAGSKDQNMTMCINDYDDAWYFIGAQKKEMFSTDVIITHHVIIGLYKLPLPFSYNYGRVELKGHWVWPAMRTEILSAMSPLVVQTASVSPLFLMGNSLPTINRIALLWAGLKPAFLWHHHSFQLPQPMARVRADEDLYFLFYRLNTPSFFVLSS